MTSADLQRRARLLRLATYWSVATAALLIVVKLVAWLETGAVSLLASLIDSLMDAAASVMNLFAVRYALRPPDEEHRFGHGKAESLAALAQAAFITGSALKALEGDKGELGAQSIIKLVEDRVNVVADTDQVGVATGSPGGVSGQADGKDQHRRNNRFGETAHRHAFTPRPRTRRQYQPCPARSGQRRSRPSCRWGRRVHRRRMP